MYVLSIGKGRGQEKDEMTFVFGYYGDLQSAVNMSTICMGKADVFVGNQAPTHKIYLENFVSNSAK